MRFRVSSLPGGHLVDFSEGPTAVHAAQALADRRSPGAWIAREVAGFSADWDVRPAGPEGGRRDVPGPVRIVLLDADRVRIPDTGRRSGNRCGAKEVGLSNPAGTR